MAKKPYYEFMRELSSTDVFKGLLGYGMFNEKLPPFLSSISFYDYCMENLPNTNGVKDKGYVNFYGMRNTNVPRQYGIPEPFAYYNLCNCLSDNWDKICHHFKINTELDNYKKSRVHIRKRYDGSIFEMNYGNWKDDGTPYDDLLLGNRYVIFADISNCFPGIYTHSIPWALIGKDDAKSNKFSNGWYNNIDLYTRNMRNGETHGILVGPHASNLISEIILTSVDKRLQKWNFTRSIDDYRCFVPTYEDAQKFLVDLNKELRIYGLHLNHNKTKIVKLPTEVEKIWPMKLKAHYLFPPNRLNYSDIQTYFNYTIELMGENGYDAAVLNYMLKILYEKELTSNAKNYLLKMASHLCLIYPYMVPLLESYIFKKCDASLDDISKLSQHIFRIGMEEQNFEIMSYSIYFAIKYGFEIKSLDINQIKDVDDCILLLISYIYYKKFENEEALELLKHRAINLKDSYDPDAYWLFIYETLPPESLDGLFKNLKKSKVSFVQI